MHGLKQYMVEMHSITPFHQVHEPINYQLSSKLHLTSKCNI